MIFLISKIYMSSRCWYYMSSRCWLLDALATLTSVYLYHCFLHLRILRGQILRMESLPCMVRTLVFPVGMIPGEQWRWCLVTTLSSSIWKVFYDFSLVLNNWTYIAKLNGDTIFIIWKVNGGALQLSCKSKHNFKFCSRLTPRAKTSFRIFLSF